MVADLSAAFSASPVYSFYRFPRVLHFGAHGSVSVGWGIIVPVE